MRFRPKLHLWFCLYSLLIVTLFSGVTGFAAPARAEKAYSSFYAYFPLYLKTGSYLYPVRYLIPKTDAPVRKAAEALVAGFPGSSLARFVAIPKDTKVLDVSVEDGMCTVDFSREILGINVGSGGEAAVIDAIVHTVGLTARVDAVRILMEGEPLETLAGHIDISGPIPVPVSRRQFEVLPDVHQHWAGGYVAALQVADIVDGYEDGLFWPERLVSRAEFVKMLTEALELEEAPLEEIPFADVSGKWHAPYIQKALFEGLLKSSDYQDSFHPDEAIPREEMALLLTRASSIYVKLHPEVSYLVVERAEKFVDLADIQERFLPSVEACVSAGLLRGYPDGTFGPRKGLTRGESSACISRLLGMQGSEEAFGILRTYPLANAAWDGQFVCALGAAAAFEANVNFRIRGGGASQLMFGYTTAASGMGYGVFGLCVDPDLFPDQSLEALELLLVSAEDGREYAVVSWDLVSR